MATMIHQREVKPGTVLMVHGYEWVVDHVRYVPPEQAQLTKRYAHLGVYRFTCHWSGHGANPNIFTDRFVCGHREDLLIAVKA
jgi:hypothetical protein